MCVLMGNQSVFQCMCRLCNWVTNYTFLVAKKKTLKNPFFWCFEVYSPQLLSILSKISNPSVVRSLSFNRKSGERQVMRTGNGARRCRPIVPAHRRLKQNCQTGGHGGFYIEFKMNLTYRANSRLAWATVRYCIKRSQKVP